MTENLSILHRVGRLARRTLTILFGAYAILMLLYFALRLIVGEQLDLVALGSSLMPTILVPALFGLILMLVLRRWRIVVLLIPAVVVLVALYGERLIPVGFRTYTTNGDVEYGFSVLTYNVASQRQNFDAMINVIREADADIVALQELLIGASDSVVAALGEVYPYRAMHPTDDFARGMGVLSKFPIIEDRYFDNITLGSQRVRLMIVDSWDIIFYNAHPVPPRTIGDFDSSLRSAEIQALLEDARQFGLTTIVMAGDFNTTDQTDDYKRIREAGFSDAYDVAGFGLGPTFPSGERWGGLMQLIPPIIRIDYVFYTPFCMHSTNTRVISDSGRSDHYPLYAELFCWNS